MIVSHWFLTILLFWIIVDEDAEGDGDGDDGEDNDAKAEYVKKEYFARPYECTSGVL